MSDLDSKSPGESPAPGQSGPSSARELFWIFNRMALRGFGGVMPIAERALVYELKWLKPKEFVESVAIAQALPGPNICNLALMIGDRFKGSKGAIASLGGLLLIPSVIVILLTITYQYFSDSRVVVSALMGMGAAAVGLIIGMGVRLAKTQSHYRLGWLLGGATFFCIALMGYPLALVILVIGLPSFLIRYWQLSKKRT